MNDLLGTISFEGDECISAEILSMPVRDDDGVILLPFLEQFRRAQHELQGIDECLHNLTEAHQKSRTVHRANASKDLKESIEKNIHLILLKSRSIQAMLHDLAPTVNSTRQNAPGPPSVQRIRTSLTNSMRKSLKDRMNLFNDLRASIEADYREIVERQYYIVSGQNPSAETVDQIIDSGQSQDLLRKVIIDQGRDQQVIDSILDLEKRQEGMKDLERDLQELHQIFIGMSALVLDQEDQMNDIEKNVVDSAYAVNEGVVQLGGAREDRRKTSKWIWGTVILLLILMAVATTVLVIVNLIRRDQSPTSMLVGFPVSLI